MEIPAVLFKLERHRGTPPMESGVVQQTLHQMLSRRLRESNGSDNMTPEETRLVIRDTYDEMHVRFSARDGCDYARMGRLVNEWLLRAGVP